MKKPNFENIESSARDIYKMTGENAYECLPEMFIAVFDRQLNPQFKKMLNEKTFKPLRAYAQWNSGFNTFLLEIYGAPLPAAVELVFHDGMPPQTSEYFEKNLRDANKILLKMIIAEMHRQNILGGAGEEFSSQVNVGVLDFSYILTVSWRCCPQPNQQNIVAAPDNFSRNAVSN